MECTYGTLLPHGSSDSWHTYARTYDVCLDENEVTTMVREWLSEDAGGFDVSLSTLTADFMVMAKLILHEPAALAGVPFVNEIFKQLDCEVTWLQHEGGRVASNSHHATGSPRHSHTVASTEKMHNTLESANSPLLPHPGRERASASIMCTDDRCRACSVSDVTVLAHVQGRLSRLLVGERLAVNVIGQLCGIATRCNLLKEMALAAGWTGRLAGTRKTTPGFRLAQKYALLVSGFDTHRLSRSDLVVLRTIHLAAGGGIEKAINRARQLSGLTHKVEVQVQNLVDAEIAARQADIILLNNVSPAEAMAAAAKIKHLSPHTLVEVSGGITDRNIRDYFNPNIDIISTSWVLSGSPACATMQICFGGLEKLSNTVDVEA